MEKSLFEQMGGIYRQEGDYLIPSLVPPEAAPIGIWGQRRQQYLRKHRNATYTALFFGGKLDAHLAEIDQQAEEMFFQLVKRTARQEGITEQLKAENQMEWVNRMNNIRNRAEEIIFKEYVYF